MPVKVYKPTTPGRRKSSVDACLDVTVKKPYKKLLSCQKKKAGRNNQGKITVRHRGGGAKRKYRIIDFKQNRFDIPAKVETIEYDPNRNSRVALVCYNDGERRYIVATDKLKVGDIIISSKGKIEIKDGNRTSLENIPSGVLLHNIELLPGKGGVLVRSAGQSAQLMGVEGKYAQLKLPSKEIRKVPKGCMATIGMVSNPDYRLIRWGKAGRTRHLGIRPTVRGKAMNPVDHPHGGGEGRNPIGLKAPKTPWGKKALGVKTRKSKKYSDKLIVKRRRKK